MNPIHDDLLFIAAFTNRFTESDFVPGEWLAPKPREDGVIEIGWLSPSATVVEWETALYDQHIIDPSSDYLGDDSVALVHRTSEDPSLIAGLDLPTLRRALTFLARAKRHTGGGWYERAFRSGMAQAATKRLEELVG